MQKFPIGGHLCLWCAVLFFIVYTGTGCVSDGDLSDIDQTTQAIEKQIEKECTSECKPSEDQQGNGSEQEKCMNQCHILSQRRGSIATGFAG